MFNANSLIISNPAYRSTYKIIEALYKISNISNFEKFEISNEKLYEIINDSSESKDKNKNAIRRLSELKKFCFLSFKKESENTVILKNIDINKIIPEIEDEDIKKEELIANGLSICLQQNNTINFIYNLIIKIEEIWNHKKNRHRKGVGLYELMYVYAYLKIYDGKIPENLIFEILTDKIIRRRFEYEKIKSSDDKNTDNKKDFYYKEIEKILIERSLKVKSIQDYMDTLLRTLIKTKLFKEITYLSKDSIYVDKYILINNKFLPKIDFFINNSILSIQDMIKKDIFLKLCYKKINLEKIYKGNIKVIEDFKNYPENYVSIDKDHYELKWFEYEYELARKTLTKLKENNKKTYKNIIKDVAIKLNEKGSPYNATANSVSDLSLELNNFVVNAEFTKIVNSYTQCLKEFIPCKTHIEDKVKSNCSYGLCIIISNIIGENLQREIKSANYSNIYLNNKNIVMIPMTTKQYINFIEDISMKKFFNLYNSIFNIEKEKYDVEYYNRIYLLNKIKD